MLTDEQKVKTAQMAIKFTKRVNDLGILNDNYKLVEHATNAISGIKDGLTEYHTWVYYQQILSEEYADIKDGIKQCLKALGDVNRDFDKIYEDIESIVCRFLRMSKRINPTDNILEVFNIQYYEDDYKDVFLYYAKLMAMIVNDFMIICERG